MIQVRISEEIRQSLSKSDATTSSTEYIICPEIPTMTEHPTSEVSALRESYEPVAKGS